MLQYCTAVTCSPLGSAQAFLNHLADQVGFGRVAAYDAHWPKTPITFFLIHADLAEMEKENVVLAIRGNGMYRFCPMLIIGEDGKPTQRSATEYRQLGFDDVILVADGNVELVRTLLEGYLMKEQLYYLTASYFGPDRRRWERRSPRPRGEDAAVAFNVYRFKREPLAGIMVIERRVVGSGEALQSAQPAIETPTAIPPRGDDR
jgi:hypothetical protein